MNNLEGMIPVSHNDSDNCVWHFMDVTKLSDHSIELSVYGVTSWSMDNEPQEVELYLTGYIKWDGCSHITFGEKKDGKQDGYLHLCGRFCWDLHHQVMANIYKYASDNISNFDKDESV